MIEVTCGACGNTLRLAEADVPPGGKTVACTRCQAQVKVAPPLGGATGDVINLADLPAPKRPSPLAGASPKPPRPPTPPPLGGRGIAAPKPLTSPLPKVPSIPAAPPPRTPAPPTSPPLELDSLDLVDLPAPVGAEPRGSIDLPAPKRASGPALSEDILDLPAPKAAKQPDIVDLPAPKAAKPSLDNLPAPKAAAPKKPDVADLPAPKRAAGPAPIDLGDLPAPRTAKPPDIVDLPTPKVSSNDAIDLPAPKGFFDDLPGPRSAAAPAPDSIAIDLPAPKGFFDDLPAPSTSTKSDLPAPKGFFDDLPGTMPPAKPAAPVSALNPPTHSKSLDLDDLDLAPPTQPPLKTQTPPAGTAPVAPARPSAMPLELDHDPDVPALELDAPAGDRFGGLDLASPTEQPKKGAAAASAALPKSGVVSFRPGGSEPEPAVISAPKPAASGLDLDLDDERGPKKKAPAARPSGARAAAKGADDGKGQKKAASPRTRKIIMGAALGVVVLGAGGWFLYQHMQEGKDADDAREQALTRARASLAADTPEHWRNAQAAATQVLASDPKNGEALAIAAIGDVAGYLDDGLDQKKRLADADKQIEALRVAGTTGPLADKALGLYGIVKDDLDGALQRLGDVATKNPKDADGQLFLGWAKAAHHDYQDAITAFGNAAANKSRTISATYAMGEAQLAIGDVDGAKKSFTAVLAANKDHIGAQVGMAETMAPGAEQEQELKGILERKDIDKGDPRARARALALQGDDARGAGRNDDARDQYAAALKLEPDYVPALVGTAELDLAAGNLGVAQTGLANALKLDPASPEANLAQADLQLRNNKPADAEAALAKLPAKLPPALAGRAKMLAGQAHEADGKLDAAVEDYAAAQVAVGDANIQPSIAEATVLGKLAAAATDPTQKAGYQQKAQALLAGFEQKAQGDADIAVELGRAYLASGDGASAEKWLAIAAGARKQDVEVRFQLAQAQDAQGKHDAAVATMREAFDLDPTRTDVGLQLAKTYASAGRTDDARAMYEKLLAAPGVTTSTRIVAGMFYVGIGDAKDAGAQGDAIAKDDDLNPAGAFLRAEGLYATGKYEDAVKLYDQASKADPQPQYLDGLGRAAEMAGSALGEGKYLDQALVAYEAAVAANPKLLASQLGRGRLHAQRAEWDKALEAFEAAKAIDPSQPDIYEGEGYCYANQGKIDLAVASWEKSLAMKPKADVAYHLGDIFKTKDEARATSAYMQAAKLAQADMASGKPRPKWLTNAYYEIYALNQDSAISCNAIDQYLSSPPTETDTRILGNLNTARLRLQCK